MIPSIDIKDYSYELPDGRIAKYPLPERDSSKLLVYKNNKVSDYIFRDLPSLLPDNSVMVFNDTKVVPARLHFQKTTGANIEIFCLSPVNPVEYNLAFASTASCTWKCVIGNAKKWKDGDLVMYNPENDAEIESISLKARMIDRQGQTGVVEFYWSGGVPFSKVLEVCGRVPIPPYLNRETEEIDQVRYQTLYARTRGSVAAPTAGLHFTDKVLKEIDARGIDRETVCLHVGAGTFLPVKDRDVSRHPMHREPFVVTRSLIQSLVQGKKIIAVGTTSVRTLESLYYIGVSIIENGGPEDVRQWAPYDREYDITTEDAFAAILGWMDREGKDSLTAGTRIIIVPGFRFRVVDVLVTNFHQPESTLILLVSAFVDGDWRTIYDHALGNGYRFLSYGDSSLLFRREK